MILSQSIRKAFIEGKSVWGTPDKSTVMCFSERILDLTAKTA